MFIWPTLISVGDLHPDNSYGHIKMGSHLWLCTQGDFTVLPPLGDQITSTMTQFHTQSHYPNTELNSPCHILVMQSPRLYSDNYKLCTSSVSLEIESNACTLPIQPSCSIRIYDESSIMPVCQPGGEAKQADIANSPLYRGCDFYVLLTHTRRWLVGACALSTPLLGYYRSCSPHLF